MPQQHTSQHTHVRCVSHKNTGSSAIVPGRKLENFTEAAKRAAAEGATASTPFQNHSNTATLLRCGRDTHVNLPLNSINPAHHYPSRGSSSDRRLRISFTDRSRYTRGTCGASSSLSGAAQALRGPSRATPLPRNEGRVPLGPLHAERLA